MVIVPLQLTQSKDSERSVMKELKPLTLAELQSQVVVNPYYAKSSTALNNLLQSIPHNTSVDEIVVKIIAIDFFYSTQLKALIKESGVHDLAEFIQHTDFDNRVRNGCPNIVSDIAENTTDKTLFSFATKYCALHNQIVYNKDDYSIYDSAVARLFPKYAKQMGSQKITTTQIEKWRKSRQYQSFNDAIGSFLDACGITKAALPQRRRIFDSFLWNQR